jgi:quercetin dioxygenase-like cupin family protein
MTESAVPEEVAKIIALAEEMPAPPEGITSRTVFKNPFARVILFRFSQGEELSEHTSASRVIVQILSGKCEFAVGAEKRTLVPGDIVYMPPNRPHSVKAIEAFSMLITLITLQAGIEP